MPGAERGFSCEGRGIRWGEVAGAFTFDCHIDMRSMSLELRRKGKVGWVREDDDDLEADAGASTYTRNTTTWFLRKCTVRVP